MLSPPFAMDLSRWFVYVYTRRRYHRAMLETADMFHNLAATSGAAALAMISPRMDLSMVFCGGVQPIIRLDIGRYSLPWRHEPLT
jgi:hypothetical protein